MNNQKKMLAGIALFAAAACVLCGCDGGRAGGGDASMAVMEPEGAEALLAFVPAEARSARVYSRLGEDLAPNGEIMLSGDDRTVVRIRDDGAKDELASRHFDVAFGPNLVQAEPREGRGRYIVANNDPGWYTAQGYAFLRGWRPMGTTDRIRVVSPSSMVVVQVTDEGEHRVMMLEGQVALVSLLADPDAPLQLFPGFYVEYTDPDGLGQPRDMRILLPNDPVLAELNHIKSQRAVKDIIRHKQ